MFLIGVVIGSFIFEVYGDKATVRKELPTDVLASASPVEEKPVDFLQSISSKVGKTLVINGIIQEAYKNKNNEVVLYIKDKDIPLLLNCTLYQSDRQIKYAIRLGESVSLRGKFTDIGDEMYLKHCKILFRSPE